jgi:hypothetical protein
VCFRTPNRPISRCSHAAPCAGGVALHVLTRCNSPPAQIWYETQTPELQAAVQGLVASRQLVFLNGGWSMHDEASPSFVDMLDNTHVGQRAIIDNFGVSAIPNVTWQIDRASRGRVAPRCSFHCRAHGLGHVHTW